MSVWFEDKKSSIKYRVVRSTWNFGNGIANPKIKVGLSLTYSIAGKGWVSEDIDLPYDLLDAKKVVLNAKDVKKYKVKVTGYRNSNRYIVQSHNETYVVDGSQLTCQGLIDNPWKVWYPSEAWPWDEWVNLPLEVGAIGEHIIRSEHRYQSTLVVMDVRKPVVGEFLTEDRFTREIVDVINLNDKKYIISRWQNVMDRPIRSRIDHTLEREGYALYDVETGLLTYEWGVYRLTGSSFDDRRYSSSFFFNELVDYGGIAVMEPAKVDDRKAPGFQLYDEISRVAGSPVDGIGFVETGEKVSLRLEILPQHIRKYVGAQAFRLGRGGWGCVYRCGGYIIKIPLIFADAIERRGVMPPTLSGKLVEDVAREAETIKGLSHQNVLRLFDYSLNPPIMVYEYADHGTLAHHVGKLNTIQTVKVTIQVLEGLRYIHSRGLVHGDLKPSNIFIVGGVAKIGDFNSLTRLIYRVSGSRKVVCTPGYCAPEQYYIDLAKDPRRIGHEMKIDIFQAANIFLDCLGQTTIDGTEAADEQKVAKALEPIKNPMLWEILKKMLKLEPWARPTAEEALREFVNVLSTYDKNKGPHDLC